MVSNTLTEIIAYIQIMVLAYSSNKKFQRLIAILIWIIDYRWLMNMPDLNKLSL